MLSITNFVLTSTLLVSMISNIHLLFPVSDPLPPFRIYAPKIQRIEMRTKIPEEDLESLSPEMMTFYEDLRTGRFLGQDVSRLSLPTEYFMESQTKNCFCWHYFRTNLRGNDEGTILYLMSDRATGTIISSGTTVNFD